MISEILPEIAEQIAAEPVSDGVYPVASPPNLEQLAGEICIELDAMERLEQNKIEKKFEIGKKLLEAKKQLKHGTFRSWLESQFGKHDWRPRKCMQLARTFKIKDFTDLDIEIVPSALEILAAPSLGMSAFEQAVEIARATAQGGKKPKLTSNIAKEVARQRSQGNRKRQQQSEAQVPAVNLPLSLDLEGQLKVKAFSNLTTSKVVDFINLDIATACLDQAPPNVVSFTTWSAGTVSINQVQPKIADFPNLDITITPLEREQPKIENFTNLGTSAAFLNSTQPKVTNFTNLNTSTAFLDNTQAKIENFPNLNTSAIPVNDLINEDEEHITSTPSLALLVDNSPKTQTTIDVSFEYIGRQCDRLNGREAVSERAFDLIQDENELKSQTKVTNELNYSHSNSYIVPNLEDPFQINCQKFIMKNFTSWKNTLDNLVHLSELELTALFEAFIEKMGLEAIIKLVTRQIDEVKVEHWRSRCMPLPATISTTQ